MMFNQKGLSLIEVLISLVIFSSVALVTGNLWNRSAKQIQRTQVYKTIALLIEQKMSEMEQRKKEFSEGTYTEEGGFGENYPNYSWSFIAKPFGQLDLDAAFTDEDGNRSDASSLIAQQLESILQESVKEAQVTIYFQTKKKKFSFSATTYFIDFEKPISLGGVQ